QMSRENWSLLLGSLKRAVKKINILLLKWRLSCMLKYAYSKKRRPLSFNDRLGLNGCFEDVVESDENNSISIRAIERTRSYNANSDDDIDRRAEVFISNFRRQLWYERQVSLELRYPPREK
ncbi:DUF761 domain-containing protein, partial [Cephalotus follicularis]